MVSRIPTGNWSNLIERREDRDIGSRLILESWTRLNVAAGDVWRCTWMESKYGRARSVWVMDRGMVSEENLQFLRDRGGLYLVGTPRGILKKFQAYLLDSDWSEVQEGIEVKLVNSPDGPETFVLCRSADRREKEKATHEPFAQRI